MRGAWFFRTILLPAGVAAGALLACGTFGVDAGEADAPPDARASSTSGTPDGAQVPDAAHRDAAAADGTVDPSGPEPEPDAGPPGCNLGPGLTLDFTKGFDPRSIEWFRSDTMTPDLAGLIAPDVDGVSRMTRCDVPGGGPSFDTGVRIVYRVHLTELPDPFDPVRLLVFGSGNLGVRLTVGSGGHARVAQLTEGEWGYDFHDFPTDSVVVTSFKRVGGVTRFCGDVLAPGAPLDGVCGETALGDIDDVTVTLPDRLDYLELGLPPDAQGASTISLGVAIDSIPP